MKRLTYDCRYVYRDDHPRRGEVAYPSRVSVLAQNQTSGIQKAARLAARRCPKTCDLDMVQFSEEGWQ